MGIPIHLFQEYYGDVMLKVKDEQKFIAKSYETFALMSCMKRLIACLVNESLICSHLINPTQLNGNGKSESGYHPFWIVLYTENNDGHFIWFPLNISVTNQNINFDLQNGTVNFLDPDDVGWTIVITETNNNSISHAFVTDVKQILSLIPLEGFNSSKFEEVVNELNNSIMHQILDYKEMKPFVPLWRPPIEYEQSIIEGHRTHPMNRLRGPLEHMKVDSTKYNFNRVNIHFYRMPKSKMNIYGSYEHAMDTIAKRLNIDYNRNTEVIIPVHELQTQIVNNYFIDKPSQQSISVKASSQLSLRTIDIDSVCDYSFKLPLGMTTTSILRTLSHCTVYIAPLMKPIFEKIIENKTILMFLDELGSIIIKDDDDLKARHFSCLLRENVAVKLANSETAIVCAYLTERSIDLSTNSYNECNIIKLFDLKTDNEKECFSRVYAKLLLDAFFGPVYKFGFTFEAHQQNVLLRVKKNAASGYELVGFIVRDNCGIRVHQPTLYEKIAMTVPVLNEKSAVTSDLEGVYQTCYHTLFHSHLQQIFRALGTHNNAVGWQFVRQYLESKKEFLENETCSKYFLRKENQFKCFLKMKFYNLDSNTYSEVPNVILFNGV